MTDIDRSRELAIVAARAAAEKQATDILAIDVREQTIITDVFVLASGQTERQVRAIVNEIDQAMSEAQAAPINIEGADNYQWVLVECPGVIIHIFKEERRAFYELERLWKDCPQIELPDFEVEAKSIRREDGVAPKIVGLE